MFRVIVPAVALVFGACAAADDAKALQGTWSVQSSSYKGEAQTAEACARMRVVFAGQTMTFTDPVRGDEKATIALDSQSTPRGLTITADRGGTVSQGIYALDGDTLKLAWNKGGATRPKELSGKKEDADGFMLLRRAKE